MKFRNFHLATLGEQISEVRAKNENLSGDHPKLIPNNVKNEFYGRGTILETPSAGQNFRFLDAFSPSRLLSQANPQGNP